MRLLLPSGGKLLAESVEAAPHAGVEAHRPGLEDDASDQIGVDAARGLDLVPRALFDPPEDAAELLVGERGRGRELDFEDALLGGDEHLELGCDLADLARAALLDDEPDEVADQLVGTAQHALEHVGLDARLRLGIVEQGGELGHVVDRGHEVLELLLHGREPALVLRRLEERARVDAVRCSYERLASSRLKSISASASSIRRFWSASVSVLRVIFSVARAASSPTCRRMSPSACTRAWSIWRSVSSSLRCLSSSSSCRIRSCCEAETLRASARIVSASPFACATSARCSSSRRRASSRVSSASSTARLIRSRRSSISFWIGENA